MIKPSELADRITKRRLDWISKNKHLLSNSLSLPEAAYRLIVYKHMNVEDGILITKISEDLIKAECRNFCPYLEACQILDMDTKFVCKEIGEPSIKAFFKEINPKLNFFRDYNQIRPYSDYCLEFVEVIN